MKTVKQIKESLAMSVGGGAVAGMPTASPPEQAPVFSPPLMLRRKKFAGKQVFVVNSDSFHKAKLGKKKFEHYSSYVGRDEVGQEIREYARQNPDEPIILEDELTGAMVYLRYGKR